MLTEEKMEVTIPFGTFRRRETILFRDRSFAPHAEEQIERMLKRVFGHRGFKECPELICWADTSREQPSKDSNPKFKDAYLVLVLYEDTSKLSEKPTHIVFIDLTNFPGPLDAWLNEEIKYPEGVNFYSVCFILPEGFEWSIDDKYNPHNTGIVYYTADRLRKMDINFEEIIRYVYYESQENFS